MKEGCRFDFLTLRDQTLFPLKALKNEFKLKLC